MSDSDRRADERPGGRHPVNIGHLVMGLAFLGLVGVWALVQGGAVDGHDVRWLLPLPWVVAGVAGLLATTLTNRDRWGARQTGWVGSEPAATTTTGDPAPTSTPTSDPTTVPSTPDEPTEEIR